MTAKQAAALRKAQRVSAQKRRKRAGTIIRTAAVAGVVIATQTRPNSITRTQITRRRIVTAHVARARDDHERMISLRAKAFPESIMSAKKFDANAARTEAKRAIDGYHRQPKSVRRIKRR